jgi:hypothetical protein
MKFLVLGFLIISLLPAQAAPDVYPDYYTLADHDKAQAEARQRTLPLVWLIAHPTDLDTPASTTQLRPFLTQMALKTLAGHAVIILVNVDLLSHLPDLIARQVRTNEQDDLLRHALLLVPKLIFTNPEATKPLGRVSALQLWREHDVEINVLLLEISHDPTALVPPTPEEIAAAANQPASPTAHPAPPDIGTWTTEDIILYSALGICVVVILFVIMRARTRTDEGLDLDP